MAQSAHRQPGTGRPGVHRHRPRKKGTTVNRLADYCECDLSGTMAVLSGRMDGGIHLFWTRPVNADGEFLPLTETKMQKLLGEGFDLKTSTGYTILPPSLHPHTGAPYEWRGDYQNPLEHPVHDMLDRLAELLIADPPRPRRIDGDTSTGTLNPRALEGI